MGQFGRGWGVVRHTSNAGRYTLAQPLVSSSYGTAVSSGPPAPVITCHILTQFGQALKTQSGDFLAPEFCTTSTGGPTFRLLAQSGDHVLIETSDFLDVQH